MRTARSFAVVLLALAALHLVCFGQSADGYLNQNNTTGLPDYGSFLSSDVDSINLANGGLSIRIPMYETSMRRMSRRVSQIYDSKFYKVTPFCSSYPDYRAGLMWDGSGDGGGGWVVGTTDSLTGGSLEWNQQELECAPVMTGYDLEGNPIYEPGGVTEVFWNYVWTDGENAKHRFPNLRFYKRPWVRNGCSEFSDANRTVAVADSGDLQLDVTNADQTGYPFTLKFPDGSRRTDSMTTGVQRVDSNGNLQGGAGVDNIGRPLGAFDANGTSQPVTIEYKYIDYSGPFPTTTGFVPNAYCCRSDVVSRISYPNGLAYQFSYDDPDNPGQTNPFGEVTQITLPTGGYIKYRWTTIAARDDVPNLIDMNTFPDPLCVAPLVTKLDARVVSEKRVFDGTSEKIWRFEYDMPGSGPGGNFSTRVYDPDGNLTVHTFAGTTSPVEVETIEYQGTNVPLRKAVRQWGGNFGPVASQVSFGELGLQVISVGDTINRRVIKQENTVYDGATTYTSKAETDYTDCSSVSWPHMNYTYCRMNPTQIREYDFNASTPTRITTNSYLHQSNSTYLNAYILNRVAEQKLYAGSISDTNLFSNTISKYDTTTVTSVTGVPYWSTPTGPRGNLTEVWKRRIYRGTPAEDTWLKTYNYYNSVGNLIQTTDPRNAITKFYYTDNFSDNVNRNSQAYLTRVELPTVNGKTLVRRFQYYWYTGLKSADCGVNFPSATTCAFSATTPVADFLKFTYDLMNRPKRTDTGAANWAEITYNESSLPISMTLQKSVGEGGTLIQSAWLDALGRVSQTRLESDPAGTVYVDTTYDGLGRKHTVSNPYRTGDTVHVTTFDYDALGRTIKVTPTDSDGTRNYSSTVYSGKVTTSTDEAGRSRKTYSDAFGRITQVDEPSPVTGAFTSPYTTLYQYDVNNNLTRVEQRGDATTSANYRIRTFEYDTLSELRRAVNPESGEIKYTYDANGNVATKADARSITITYGYDLLNRLISKSYSNGQPTLAYGYDETTAFGTSVAYGLGRRSSMCTPNTGYTCPSNTALNSVWSYDLAGNVASEKRTISGVSKTFTYAYNADSGLKTLTYPGGMQLKYTYNNVGQPITVQSLNLSPNISFASNAQYTAHGAIKHIEYGNTGASLISIDNTYNERLQPDSISAGTSGSRLLWLTYDFGLDNANNGNVLQVTNNRDAGRTKMFQYDYLNRLKQADTSRWGNTYDIDAWGNLLQKNQITSGKNCTGYSTQCGEYLQQQVDTSNRLLGHTYDLAGNQTDNIYSYSAENMLVNAGGMTYTYDADNSRVKKSDGMTYWYGLGNVLTETNSSTGLNRDYVFLGGQRIAYRDSSGVRFYLKDHLGSSSVVTDGAASTSEMDYYPFGADLLPASAERYRFTGKERDSETTLDYFGARYYGSSMARFAASDPVFVTAVRLLDPQQLNAYAYSRNNPLAYIDPNGKDIVSGTGPKKEVENALTEIASRPGGREFLDKLDNLSIEIRINHVEQSDTGTLRDFNDQPTFEQTSGAPFTKRGGDVTGGPIEITLDTYLLEIEKSENRPELPQNSGEAAAHGLVHVAQQLTDSSKPKTRDAAEKDAKQRGANLVAGERDKQLEKTAKSYVKELLKKKEATKDQSSCADQQNCPKK